jgi:hypothetical protein
MNEPLEKIESDIKVDGLPFEYGAMSSKYRLYAKNKLTAYCAMVLHYSQSAHLIALYSPEEIKEDNWFSMNGKISERLDEIFGGEGSFDKYISDNFKDVKSSYKSIEKIV